MPQLGPARQNIRIGRGRALEPDRLYRSGDYDGAIRSVRELLRIAPRDWKIVNSLAQIYGAKGDHETAVKHARTAKAYAPDAYAPRDVLIKSLVALGDIEGALEELDAAEALFPAEAEIQVLRGHQHVLRREPEQAIARFEKALALSGGDHPIVADLIYLKRSIFDWSRYDADDATARRLVREGKPLSPLTMISLNTDSQEQLDACVLWSRQFARSPVERLTPKPTPRERLRVGYLSGDFHNHATSHLIVELIEKHDRAAFEIIGFSYGPDDGSPIRARVTAAFDRFVRLNDLPDRAAAQAIARCGLDVLIDLKGYTENARTGILGYRPAPVQVNYLGFPGSMGADFIDYVIADAHVAPMSFQPFCVEKIVQLPGCFQPNDSRRVIDGAPIDRAQHGLPADAFVLGCFNSPYKVGPAALAAWRAILERVDNSVLWLFAPSETARRNLAAEASARGLPLDRLVFAPPLASAQHLARLRLADLCLDTLPVGAFTTASDALWAGAPILTQAGKTPAGRGALSLLRAMGLDALIADDAEAYVETAVALARDPARLAALRDKIAEGRAASPLFDAAHRARALEAAYREMARRAREGLPPAAFRVAG